MPIKTTRKKSRTDKLYNWGLFAYVNYEDDVLRKEQRDRKKTIESRRLKWKHLNVYFLIDTLKR